MQRDPGGSDVTDTVKATLKDAAEGLKIFAVNPVGGLPAFFKGLGKQRALGVGIAFAVIYVVSFLFGVNELLRLSAGNSALFNLTVAAILTFGSIVGASFITRKIFRGSGSFEGDVFIAGASLLPTAFFIILAKVLGSANFELIAAIAVIAITYTILMVYTGCTQVSGIPETAAALSVSVMILLSVWLLKTLIFASISGI